MWFKQDLTKPNQIFKPMASYVSQLEELRTFMNKLVVLKLPLNYGGALGKHIMDKKFESMKSHDWHIMMQQLMPLALRGLMWISRVFSHICAKV
jgi:hypothetical protein